MKDLLKQEFSAMKEMININTPRPSTSVNNNNQLPSNPYTSNNNNQLPSNNTTQIVPEVISTCSNDQETIDTIDLELLHSVLNSSLPTTPSPKVKKASQSANVNDDSLDDTPPVLKASTQVDLKARNAKIFYPKWATKKSESTGRGNLL